MKLDKIINNEAKEYVESGRKVDEQTEKELTAYAKEVKSAIDSGEIKEWDITKLVNAYIKLAGPTLTKKKEMSLRVKLIKTPKRLIIRMLNTAIKAVFKNI